MVKKITNNSFEEVKNTGAALVDFSATWCGPCKMLAPLMDQLSEELEDKVEFFNADVDENMELAGEYEISSIPALVLFKNGKKVDMLVGFRPKAAIKDWIETKL